MNNSHLHPVFSNALRGFSPDAFHNEALARHQARIDASDDLNEIKEQIECEFDLAVKAGDLQTVLGYRTLSDVVWDYMDAGSGADKVVSAFLFGTDKDEVIEKIKCRYVRQEMTKRVMS